MTLQTATKSQRAVCFSPEKRPLLHTLQQTKSPVKITNFRTSDNYSKDIVIDKKTVISPIPKDDSFTYKEANQESVLSIASLQEAASEQLVSVKAKVINIQSPKVQPTSSFGPLKKQECTIVDLSKSIQLILWQQNVEMLQLNNTYLFKGLRLKEGPSGNKYLNTPRGGEFSYEEVDPFTSPLAEVENIPTLTTLQIQASIVGVQQISKYRTCVKCGKKAESNPGTSFAICKNTKCNLKQKETSCKSHWFGKVVFGNTQKPSDTVTLSVFNQQIEQLLTHSQETINKDKATPDELTDAIISLPQVNITYDTINNKLVEV